MSDTVLIWCCIIALMMFAFLTHWFQHRIASRRSTTHAVRPIPTADNHPTPHHRNRHHLIELGREREMFYIPGDRKEDYGDDFGEL